MNRLSLLACALAFGCQPSTTTSRALLALNEVPSIDSVKGDDASGNIGTGIVISGSNLATASVRLFDEAMNLLGDFAIATASADSLSATLTPALAEAIVASGSHTFVIEVATTAGAARQTIQVLQGEAGPRGATGEAGPRGEAGQAGIVYSAGAGLEVSGTTLGLKGLSGGCAPGQLLAWSADGAIVCSNPVEVTTAPAGGLVNASGLALKTCATGNTLRRTTTGWDCSSAYDEVVALPAFEFRGVNSTTDFYSQAYSPSTASVHSLAAPLHLPAGAVVKSVACTFASTADVCTYQTILYASVSPPCSSLVTIGNSADLTITASCTRTISPTQYYYIQVNGSAGCGFVLKDACYVTYHY